MTVIFGTTLLAITLTSLAPERMMPACSESRPTMKPLTSCRKINGSRLWLQSMMKRGTLFAASRLAALALIGDDADRDAAQPPVAAHQRRTEFRLVLVERTGIEQERQK